MPRKTLSSTDGSGPSRGKRRICFVTGTRAEFGLMCSTLRAIGADPRLQLQLVVTGMHLDPAHGGGVAAIRDAGWRIDAIVPWPCATGPRAPAALARHTGHAMAHLAEAFERLDSDVILVVGDRVEAFAAAAAAHISGRLVAHVHGGDRALGQVDDSLRHAITKLAHVHFPATRASARRIARLGEDRWRIHLAGSPGVDDILAVAAPWRNVVAAFPNLRARRYAVLLLHPAGPDEQLEYRRARMVLRAAMSIGVEHVVIIHPNNDPGCRGIIRCWRTQATDARCIVRKDVERSIFLGLLRDAAVLLGNSSSGIIEAASFRTPVVDIGPRQLGRERSRNVRTVAYAPGEIREALEQIWRDGRPRRGPGAGDNVYGAPGAGRRIARVLGRLRPSDDLLRRKLIVY